MLLRFWGREAKAILKEAKRYLKTDFKSHVGPEERYVDHCTGFSLSDPNNDAFAQQYVLPLMQPAR